MNEERLKRFGRGEKWAAVLGLENPEKYSAVGDALEAYFKELVAEEPIKLFFSAEGDPEHMIIGMETSICFAYQTTITAELLEHGAVEKKRLVDTVMKELIRGTIQKIVDAAAALIVKGSASRERFAGIPVVVSPRMKQTVILMSPEDYTDNAIRTNVKYVVSHMIDEMKDEELIK